MPDGLPNFLDVDSDEDGILDEIEFRITQEGGFSEDGDGDLLPNWWDSDSGKCLLASMM